MSNYTIRKADLSTSPDSSHFFFHLRRFLRAVRRRWWYVAIPSILALIGGIALFLVTKPVFVSRTVLLLRGVDPESTDHQDMSSRLVSTYEKVLLSDSVLHGAIQRLHSEESTKAAAGFATNAKALRRQLKTRSDSDTNFIELECRLHNSQAARDINRMIVASALDFSAKSRQKDSNSLANSLETERVALQTRLLQKEREVLEAKRSLGTIAISQDAIKTHPSIQRLFQLNETLIKLEQRRVEITSLLNSMRQTAKQGGDLTVFIAQMNSLIGQESVQQILHAQPAELKTLEWLQRQRQDEEAQLATMLNYYGKSHPETQRLYEKLHRTRTQEAGLQSHLSNLQQGNFPPEVVERLLKVAERAIVNFQEQEQALQQECAIAKQQVDQLNAMFSDISSAERELVVLTNLHDALVNRLAKIDISGEYERHRLTVVQEPTAPEIPVSPNLARTLLGCFVGGIGLGLTIVYLFDVLDDRFRSPEEIQEQSQVPVLAMVQESPQVLNNFEQLVEWHRQASPGQVEAFRTLRTAISIVREESECVSVTSTEPQDGKTFVLANLAISLAMAGKKVLLIDADMRRPGSTRLFGLRDRPGLSEFLQHSEQRTANADRIQVTPLNNLCILPSGLPPSDPIELLSSPKFSEFVSWAEIHFDEVLIDCPPSTVASDASIIGRVTKSVIYVLDPEKNHRQSVLRAIDRLQLMGASLLGTVINRLNAETDESFQGYTEGYGYSDYHEAENSNHPTVLPRAA